MKKVFLDNAATTPLAPEVIEVLTDAFVNWNGNPSAVHATGRATKAKLEMARKTIAKHINALPSEIFFTSGGTEADNLAILTAVRDLKVKRIITSQIEHHAVLKTVLACESEMVKVEFVNLKENGSIDLHHLIELIENSTEKTLVSLMHVNNEIGNILPFQEVANICAARNVLFHSDTVQSLGYFQIDVQKTPVDFLACSAHKFHGPKGVGFMYCRQKLNIKPVFHGGSQERGIRPGTENTPGILGLEKAFTLAVNHRDENIKHLQQLKTYFINLLNNNGIKYDLNGDYENASPAILNISFPIQKEVSLLLFHLDLKNIAVSGGSACSSGSVRGSHVLNALQTKADVPTIRFSFSKYTLKEQLDYTVEILKELLVVS